MLMPVAIEMRTNLAALPRPGLMLGFTGYTPEQLRRAVDDLARAIMAGSDRGDDIVSCRIDDAQLLRRHDLPLL